MKIKTTLRFYPVPLRKQTVNANVVFRKMDATGESSHSQKDKYHFFLSFVFSDFI